MMKSAKVRVPSQYEQGGKDDARQYRNVHPCRAICETALST